MTRTFMPDEARILSPIPANSPPAPAQFSGLNAPAARWCYTDALGNPLYHVLRFERTVNGLMEKTIRPLSLWQMSDGRTEWLMKQIPAPRPLYNLFSLARTPEAEVVVVEGEKTADAAARLFPSHVVTTSSGGAKSAEKSDWSPLAGRDCLLVPDCDEPGRAYAETVVQRLRDVGAARIRMLDITRIGCRYWVDGEEFQRSEFDIPRGYDLADAEAEGWTAEKMSRFISENPETLQAFDVSPQENHDPESSEGCEVSGFHVSDEGLFKIENAMNRKTGARIEKLVRISGPLYVTGYIQNSENSGWGRVVQFFDPNGNKKTAVISAQDLAGTGLDVIRKLLAEGLSLIPNRFNVEGIVSYLLTSDPKERVFHAVQPGWCKNSIALPGMSFGPDTVDFHSELSRLSA